MFRPLDRRTLLKASGVSLALPLLESMNPVSASPVESPQRMVLICTTLGLHAPALWPKTDGAEYASSEYLELLKDHREELTLFSGLQHGSQSGRRPHDSEATWLSAARNPGIAGFRNSVSVDQVASKWIGNQTRFSSITLSSNNSVSQSYTSGGVMIPAKSRPAKLFADLFLQGNPHDVQRQRSRLQDGKSILDHLGAELRRIDSTTSASDRRLLADYYEAVRQAERNISDSEGWMEKPKPHVTKAPPRDVKNKADLVGRVEALMQLIPLIIQTDSSRVIAVMIQDHNVVPKIQGVDGNHHNLSHHGQDLAKINQLRIVESELIRCFADLLTQMKSTAESESSLLGSTSVLFGSNLGNANIHDTRNLPIMLAGGGFQHGKYIRTAGDTPLSNLYLTMLRKLGIEQDSFGQSTGTLSW